MSLDKLGNLVEKRNLNISNSSLENGEASKTPTLRTEINVEFSEHSRLPLGLIKLESLIEILAGKFGLTIDERSRQAINQLYGSTPEHFSEVSYLDFDKQVPFVISFENGLIPSSAGSMPVSINRCLFRVNTCLIAIVGSDEDADRALSQMFKAINELAGLKKEISPDAIHAKSHGTASITKLRLGLVDALSERLLSAIKETVGSDEDTFKKVGALRVSDRSSDMEKYKIVPKLSELEISIHRMDLEAGDAEACRLSISPRTKSDVGLGEYLILSEYDNETHHKLVAVLKEKLGDE